MEKVGSGIRDKHPGSATLCFNLCCWSPQEGGGDANNPEKKARKRIKRSATVEKNIKNLNVAKFELEFDVDPLFKKTSSQVDILDHKVLTYVEYRAVSDVFQNIDHPTPLSS
jgi:hypothetical protein